MKGVVNEVVRKAESPKVRPEVNTKLGLMSGFREPFLQRAKTMLCRLCDSKSPFWFYWAPHLLILMVTLSVGCMFALIFLMGDRLDSLESPTLAKSLKDSQLLMMFHCVLLGSAIPMLLDVFLDFIVPRLRKDIIDEATVIQFRTRALLLVCSLVVTIMYGSILLFGNDADLRKLPFLYVASNHTAKLAFLSTIMLPLMSLRIIPHAILLGACILLCIAAPLQLIHLLSPSHENFLEIEKKLLLVSFLLFMASFAAWGRDVWRRYRESRGNSTFKVETTEFICIIYCSMLIMWAIVSMVFTGRAIWRDSDESNLWPVVMVQIIIIASMTIIPGRISSADAQSSQQMLSQKRAYVRFVSHEIRSPLSIVAAGLEFFVEHLAKADPTNPPSSSPAAAAASAPPNRPNTYPNELLELANDLSEANDMAINILNDLLQYESMDAGMFKLEAACMNPGDLFKAKTLGIIAKRHSLTLDVVPPAVEDGVFVLADVYRIDQVVRNLVTNACKFTPAGGTIVINSKITLTDSSVPALSASSSSSGSMKSLKHITNKLVPMTSLEETVPSFTDMHVIRCGSLRVKVNDTGIGIQEHNKDKLFQQFEQFDKNKLQEGGGSGLGLWISHFIVARHGGKLQFESLGPGKGSVFFFDLPLYRQQHGTTQATTCTTPMLELPHLLTFKEDSYSLPRTKKILRALSAAILPPVPGSERSCSEDFVGIGSAIDEGKAPGHMSYLLVDDSKGNRKMLRRMLENDDSILVSSIQEAEDGFDAVALVVESGSAPDKPLIDCIFMDSVMKQMHGPEAVRYLRSELGFKGKIMGLTGNAMEDDVKHFQQAGLDQLLIKPLRKAQLIEALSAHEMMPSQLTILSLDI